MKWLRVVLLIRAVFGASENPDENLGVHDPNLFEGDMILTPEQRLEAEMGLDVDSSLKRGSVRNRLWPDGIVARENVLGLFCNRHLPLNKENFTTAVLFLASDSRAVAAIKAGLEEWTTKTCIRFKKRTNEDAFIAFKRGSGCSSYVGRTGRRQYVNLARGCWYRGTVAHEIGHAISFYHEQSRPDRDNYVTILWENITEKNKFNFHKYPRSTIDALGTKYDYGSLMHYGSKAFSKNGKPTIVAKQPGVTLGQRRGLSSIDAEQANLLYKSLCAGRGDGGAGISTSNAGGRCQDKDSRCRNWTRYCSFHNYVRANCKKTCKLC
ncbi:blastula protease 10-like [Oculina patagonica]